MAMTEALEAAASPVITKRRFVDSRYFFPLLLLLIIIGFYWKLTLTKQYDWIWGPDLAQQVMPWFEEEARQFQHSQIPLWDPHAWLGQPMLGQAQPGTAYPLNWILFLIPRHDGHIRREAFQWYFIAIHYMAALFCYLLCRDLGRSRAASLIAGVVFSLATYVGTTDWPQMVNGAVWAPLVFLFQLRAVRGYRPFVSAALCGTFLGMAWLAGHHQVPIYTTLAVSGVWIYFALRNGRIDWNVAKLAALALIFMVLVGAAQILPAQEYGHLAKRWAGADHELTWNEPVPYYVHREYSMGPISLFGILIPGMNRHSDPFVGVVAFVLALLAILLGWKQQNVKIFAALAIAAIVYSLGHNSVFQGLIYAVVPVVEKARVPSMATIIWGVAVAVLAAFGVDQFMRNQDAPWVKTVVKGTLGFGLLLYTLVLLGTYAAKGWSTDDRVMLTALFAVLLAALLHGWRTGNLSGKAALTLLILMMLMELGNDSGYAFPHRSDKDMGQFFNKVVSNGDIANYLHQQPGVFRIEPETESLALNWGTYYNFDYIKAYNASVTINVLNLEWHTWQTRLLYGVRYSISEKPPINESREVFTGESGLKVYENPSAFPRAWAVHELFQVKQPDEGRRFINDHLGELHGKAFMLAKPPAVEQCGAPDQVDFKKYEAEKITIGAQMGCRGMVILSDAFFPGWKATVDGKPADILEVDIAMRGVVVPEGKHELIMKYRPGSAYLGFFLTVLGWLGAVGLAVYGPKGER